MKQLPFIVLILTLLTACHKDTDEPEAANKQARRTVLVYMTAQNSLGSGRWHRADSAEIMYGRQFIPNNDRMLVYVDDAHAPRLYRIARQWDKPQLIKQWTRDVCSTSPNQFAEVVKMAQTDFPSNELALVMWSHADGWLPATNKNYADFESAPTSSLPTPSSYGIDSGPTGGMSDKGAQMDITDMAKVLQQNGVHCKYILFDCCLMQNLEVDYALRHVTDYIIASPMSIASPGAYYTHLMQNGLFAANPQIIAKTYCEDVLTDVQGVYGDFGIAISCVRTDQLQPLADALKTALSAQKLSTNTYPDMTNVLAYQTYTSRYYYRPHNYDALQAIERIVPPTYRADVVQQLNNAVVCHYATNRIWLGPYITNGYATMPTDTNRFCAVSMFIPQNIYNENASQCPYGNLNAAFLNTEWGKYVFGEE